MLAWPDRQIMRQTGRSRKLVRQVLRGEREDVFRIRESSLTPWLPELEREWAGGCRNGAELWRRLRADGFRGSLRVLRLRSIPRIDRPASQTVLNLANGPPASAAPSRRFPGVQESRRPPARSRGF